MKIKKVKETKKVKEIIAYMLDTYDMDVINHYTDMIMNIFYRKKK